MKIDRIWLWIGFGAVPITILLDIVSGVKMPISPAFEAFGVLVWLVCLFALAADMWRFVRRIYSLEPKELQIFIVPVATTTLRAYTIIAASASGTTIGNEERS